MGADSSRIYVSWINFIPLISDENSVIAIKYVKFALLRTKGTICIYCV